MEQERIVVSEVKRMSEYERKVLADLRDVQDRILEVMYGETNIARFKRLHKWAAQTDTFLAQEQRYIARKSIAA